MSCYLSSSTNITPYHNRRVNRSKPVKTPQRILHLISQRPDSTGSGIYLQALLAQASRKGYRNFLLAGLQQGETAELAGVSSADCHYVYFDNDNPDQRIIGMSDVMPYDSRKFLDQGTAEITEYLNKFKILLLQIVPSCQPDIIHTHHLWLLSSLVKKLFPQIPVVGSCHGSDLRQFDQCQHLRQKVIDGCSELDMILALHTQMSIEILKRFSLSENRVAVVGGGYDHSQFFQSQSPYIKQNKTILYAGKISKAKGVPWLLKAMHELIPRGYELHLAGDGSGEEAETIKRQALELGSAICYHGPVSHQQLARLMRDSTLFVLPSLFEGLPLVIIEALASGCAVIATDLPGTRDIRDRIEGNQLMLVETPRTKDIANTHLEDETSFVQNLSTAIEEMFRLHQSHPNQSPDLSYFRWSSVFTRIEKIWQKSYVRALNYSR